MADRERMIECAAAIRMSCQNASLDGKPWVVALDDSDDALAWTSGEKGMSETASKLGVGPVPEFGTVMSGARIAETLEAEVKAGGAVPGVVSVTDVGLFGVGRTRSEARERTASLQEQRSCRVRKEAPGSRQGRLGGHVVVVTGSAQGFGKGIAEELAGQGAHVVLADISDETGEATRKGIDAAYGEGTSIYVKADVTDPDSLNALVAEAFKAFGGIDIFVANAGVLRAGALHEMEPKTFEFVTKVNYTAFYLCSKAVAPALKLQHTYDSSYFADIVQVNSKSGLQGSNRNFAYAGSKFGSIGLVQSFALELIEHNIKVNAVCPGNYFEGPLWSDPEKGLFVQYLNAGKVPGAKTIDDVKRFYMDKVPMRRGCLPSDVARAILYLHEQQYETGQALPITGGQVMLS